MSFETLPLETLELQKSPHGTYTIFDLPPTALPAAERIVAGLKERAFMVHLLQGDDRPDGMANPYGLWPHPDEEALEIISRESGLPVQYESEQTAATAEAVSRAAWLLAVHSTG